MTINEMQNTIWNRWKKKKQLEGWRTIHRFVPADLALLLEATCNNYRIGNPTIYRTRIK